MQTLVDRLTAERAGVCAPAALPVTSIAGMGGVGKTALATHVAHLVREAYPDGQLWANLTNPDASPVDPAEVLGRFLRALGMPYRAIPAGPAERAEAYRTGRPTAGCWWCWTTPSPRNRSVSCCPVRPRVPC
ncbi:hypothetical protein NKG94_00340 [Micromonospora sp. M12]